MKKLESTLPNMVIVLGGVTLVASGLLGAVEQVTEAPIAAIEKQTLAEGIKNVMLGGQPGDLEVTSIDTVSNDNGEFIVYGATQGGQPIGEAVKTTVTGFSPGLTVLVGFGPDGVVRGYQILKHAETPGLGAKAGDWFQKDGRGCIIGRDPAQRPLQVKKDTNDPADVDAITASTITSRAFLRAVNICHAAIHHTDHGDALTGATQHADRQACQADSTAAPADTTALSAEERTCGTHDTPKE